LTNTADKVEIFVNGSKLNSFGYYTGANVADDNINIPVKAGSNISFKSFYALTKTFSFIEYKLHGINSSPSYGSGGVISDTVLTSFSGTFKINSTDSTYIYTVQNDSGVCIEDDDKAVGYYLDKECTKVLYKHADSGINATN
jgi:hypothetical protein